MTMIESRHCDWCKLMLSRDSDPVVIGRGHVHRGHCAAEARDWLWHARATVDFWGDADTDAQYAPPSWVSVSEAVPESSERVFVMAVAPGQWFDGMREIAVYHADGWDADDDIALPYEPTHWMPLPAPPEVPK